MAVTRVRIVYYSHSCECRGVPFHSPLQLRALVVYTLLVVLSPQGVSQGLLYPPRGLIHTLFASPLDGTVSSSFPHPPPLQRRWQTHFPQLTLRLAQNFSPITYLRQGIEWLSHECELFTIHRQCLEYVVCHNFRLTALSPGYLFTRLFGKGNVINSQNFFAKLFVDTNEFKLYIFKEIVSISISKLSF